MDQAASSKTDIHQIADHLWATADELRANSHLKAAEYSIPVLGLIFLKFADSRFTQLERELADKSTSRREIGKANYQAKDHLPIRQGIPRPGSDRARQAARRRRFPILATHGELRRRAPLADPLRET
jgi:type I restriction-modification system DNA methylase subunit